MYAAIFKERSIIIRYKVPFDLFLRIFSPSSSSSSSFSTSFMYGRMLRRTRAAYRAGPSSAAVAAGCSGGGEFIDRGDPRARAVCGYCCVCVCAMVGHAGSSTIRAAVCDGTARLGVVGWTTARRTCTTRTARARCISSQRRRRIVTTRCAFVWGYTHCTRA